jgi:hypothetical protein
MIRDRDHVRWRERCLVAARFPREIARELARDERVDVHALLELTDRGCPPLLAARILAPLEERPRAS